MKKLKGWKHEREFDTKTIATDITQLPEAVSEETKETIDRKSLGESEIKITIGQKTQVYKPRPLTPDDDIYEDIIEQFASAPTKPKYWFEEFGDYWSCSCGHINKGDHCKSCGLSRELLRSLFILHKPGYAASKLDKKVKRAQKKVDREEQQYLEKESRRKEREASGEDLTVVTPIEPAPAFHTPMENDETQQTAQDSTGPLNSAHPGTDESGTQQTNTQSPAASPGQKDAESSPAGTSLRQTGTAKKPPAKIKFTEINVAEAAGAGNPSGKKRAIIVASIAICLILIGICGYVIYTHMAAPAMKYEEAQELQAAGKYQQAIEKYESLADYKDSREKIWQCYVSMGDDQYANGKYEKAIKTYEKALKLKKSDKIDEKIRNCYIAIGDRQYSNGEYEDALKTYIAVIEMGDSDELQEKINAAKLAYVKAFQAGRTSQVEQYMSELMALKYPGIQEIYDAYYAWHVKILANTSETDYSTDIDTASRKDTVYFHALISGGEPNESVELYYEVTWPNGSKQIYGLDSKWQNGSKITARFQYPIPLFGKEGKLTFTLYDKNTNEAMGSDSITFQN